MKKFLKSKIFLAIVSITLISGLLLGGTYAWFVISENADVIGGAAVINSATFGLDVTGYAGIGAEKISLFADVASATPTDIRNWRNTLDDTDIIGTVNIEDVCKFVTPGELPELREYISKLYPSEGVRFMLEDLSALTATFVNNREIVVSVDLTGLMAELNNLEEKLENLKDAAGNASSNDIYFEVASASRAVGRVGDVFYFYFDANADALEIAEILEGISVEFGIIGINRDQTHYQDIVTDFTMDNIEIEIIAVQATPQAIFDVFGLTMINFSSMTQSAVEKLFTTGDSHSNGGDFELSNGGLKITSDGSAEVAFIDMTDMVPADISKGFRLELTATFEGGAATLLRTKTDSGVLGAWDDFATYVGVTNTGLLYFEIPSNAPYRWGANVGLGTTLTVVYDVIENDAGFTVITATVYNTAGEYLDSETWTTIVPFNSITPYGLQFENMSSGNEIVVLDELILSAK